MRTINKNLQDNFEEERHIDQIKKNIIWMEEKFCTKRNSRKQKTKEVLLVFITNLKDYGFYKNRVVFKTLKYDKKIESSFSYVNILCAETFLPTQEKFVQKWTRRAELSF